MKLCGPPHIIRRGPVSIQYRFKTLEDFLISTPLTVDGTLNDGWGAYFPVKGKEIEATILFADIGGFSARTKDLSPTETLIFVNNFFSWITAEAFKDRPCIVDKYIGDAVMLLFAKDFGSEDPFVDALQTARWMAEFDAHGFCPHMGVATGLVTAGFVGTPVKYNCSVLGLPVTLASRCASVKPEKQDRFYSSSIAFPASEWASRDFDKVFPPRKTSGLDGELEEEPHGWELLPERIVDLRNLGETSIREIANKVIHLPSLSPEDRARLSLNRLKEAGLYRPQLRGHP